MSYGDEKKYHTGNYSSKVVENALLHKNLIPFSLIHMQRKGMCISAKNVCLGVEKLSIDRDVFESFSDVKTALDGKKELMEKT